MRGGKKKGTSEDLFDQRTQQVLQGIIDNFISTSEPVGSRTLSKTLGLSLSPAGESESPRVFERVLEPTGSEVLMKLSMIPCKTCWVR